MDQTRISGLRVTEQTRISGSQVTDKQYDVSISKEDIQESCIQSFQALSTLSSLVKEGTVAGIYIYIYIYICTYIHICLLIYTRIYKFIYGFIDIVFLS
jgi:hypothetical protein